MTLFNQEACGSSRILFVEGTREQVDRFCEALLPELGVERPTCSASGPAPPTDLREEITALAAMEPDYRVWGRYDGSGTVVRSEQPVEFYPSHRVANVVRVDSLHDTMRGSPSPPNRSVSTPPNARPNSPTRSHTAACR